MKRKQTCIYAIVSGILMLIIILDGKTTLQSAINGVDLCLRTVIPSLFPFFILTGILNNAILGQDIPLLRPIGKFCKIPAGSESILLLGLIAGYPVGAQLVGQAYHGGNLSRKAAERMAAFCNNAGPAFIFGILSTMFACRSTVWIIWGIQITSSLIVSMLLPSFDHQACVLNKKDNLTVTAAMNSAIKTMASVCGWVVIFKVLLGFCQFWFLWRMPVSLQVLFSGLLELSNGCIRLHEVSSEGVRFVLACILLSAGGLCVTMQTLSVGGNIISRTYFLGKGAQLLVSTLLAIVIQGFLFTGTDRVNLPISVVIGLVLATILCLFLIFHKKM